MIPTVPPAADVAADVDCLRTKSVDELNDRFRDDYASINIVEVFHDVGFGPHVDGVLTSKTPLEALHDGQVRPNTPISWNYNRDDIWILLAEGKLLNTLSMMAEFQNLTAITELQTTSGIEYASDLTDQMFIGDESSLITGRNSGTNTRRICCDE